MFLLAREDSAIQCADLGSGNGSYHNIHGYCLIMTPHCSLLVVDWYK